MRDLGRAATMATIAATALGLWGCGQAGQPGTGEASEPLGYVILDRTAREAGVRIDGVSSDDAVLPVELSPTSKQTLVGPAGRVPLEIGEDEVVYVHGRSAQLERGTLDHEVARDRVSVVGSESAARALADDIGGVVDARGGRLVVVGPGALAGLARAAMPEGLEEVVPVAPDDAAGLPAFANIVEAGDGERLTPTPLVQSFDWPSFIKSRIAEPADELLPEVVSCTDPIAGTWVSREHYPQYGDWYRFELIVRRDPRDPSSILGAIRSRSWGAGADLADPTSCEGTTFDWTVRMSAAGGLTGEQVSFGGASHATESTRCGVSYNSHLYNNDRFTGQLVDGGRYIAAVNNDGDRAKNEPHLFRRISCN
jgi:hypothetical protein